MSINVDVHGNTDPLVRDVDAAVKRINRTGGIKIRIDDKGVTQPLGNMKRSADEFTKSLEASNARVLAFGASVGIINAVSDAFKGLVTQTIAVEKNLTDINVVMGLTSKQLDKFGGGLFKVAAETGAGFQAASEAATEFARQGLSVAETLKRTKDALVLTRLTGMKSTEAVKSLTAAMNTFKGEVKDSTQLVSKFAAVDVKFAVSAQDFADAIARAGQAARDAGVDIDQLIGLVTAAQERTARGGAVIGNSFKTIFTRVQRGSTLKELEKLGVAVSDLEGKTLPAMKVLQGLASRYDTLTDAQKSYISQNVAGVFQINILKAAMADLGKANSVTAQATQIAASATDESSKKNEQLRQTMAALAGETGVAIQQLAKSIGDIALAPGINKVLDGVKGMADFAQGLLGDGEKEGSKFAKGLLAGVGNFLSGPGLVVLTAVVAKLFANAVKYGAQSLTSLLNINKAANQRKNIEQSLMMVMAQNAALSEEMLRNDLSRAEKEKLILNLIKQQTIEAQKLANISKSMTPGLLRSGVNQNLSYSRRGNRAFGFVPNFAADDEERKQAQAGGYAPGSVKAMNIPGHGPVIYNSAEKVKKFDGMSQPAIMPPSHSRAGKKYKDDFASAHGFDPYASHGFIPNFSLQALRSYLDKGGRAGSLNFPSLKKMQPYHHEFSKEWKGDRSSVSQYYGSPFPSKKDMDNYVKKHGYKDSEDFKKGLAAPGKALAAQQKILQKERVRKANSIDLNDPFYGINNINRLGVMLGSGNQVTKDTRYYQPFKELPSGNKDYLKQKWLSQYKGFNPSKQPKRAPKNASPTDKAKANEGIKKWKSINEKYQEWQSKQVSVKLPTKALYPVDLDDTNGMKGAIGKGQIKNLFSSNLSSGMDGLSNQLFSKIFPGKKSSITKSIDHITNNQSILGGLLEAGISAALGEKPTDDIGRAFDFEGSSAKTLAKWMGEENLNKIELKISDIASKTGKLPNKTLNVRNKAFGFIPNFADPLSDAIGREKEAGVPVSKIRVGTHKALVHKSNPMGMGVTNTDDEPRGLKDVFGARGFVPNYAESRREKIGGMFGSEAGIERMKKAAEETAREMESFRAKLTQLTAKKSDLIDAAKSQKRVLQERHNQLKKDADILKQNSAQLKNDMNNRRLSSKQRQKAAQEFIRLEQNVKNSTQGLNKATQELTRARQRVSKVHGKMRESAANYGGAERANQRANQAVSRREKISNNRGMAGMAGMMGMSMLAGQLEQSDDQGTRNAAGALNGASMGASIGMMFGPWGTAIGAAAGGLMGFVNSTRKAEEALEKLAQETAEGARQQTLNRSSMMIRNAFKNQDEIFNEVLGKERDPISANDSIEVEHKSLYNTLQGAGIIRPLDDLGVKRQDYLKSAQQRSGKLEPQWNPVTATFGGAGFAKKSQPNLLLSQAVYGDDALRMGIPQEKGRSSQARKMQKILSSIFDGVGLESHAIERERSQPTVHNARYKDLQMIEFMGMNSSANEMSQLAVAEQLATSDQKLTRKGLKTQAQIDADPELKRESSQINTMNRELKKKIEDAFKLIPGEIQTVSTTIKAAAVQGKTFKEQFEDLGNKISSTTDKDTLQRLNKTLRATSEDFLNEFSQTLKNKNKDFEMEVMFDGNMLKINNKTLKHAMHAAKLKGKQVELQNAVNMAIQQQIFDSDKIEDTMKAQLTKVEVVTALQSDQISIQRNINSEMQKIVTFYSLQAASLGKSKTFDQGLEGFTESQKAKNVEKRDSTLAKNNFNVKSKIITDLLTGDRETTTALRKQYKTGDDDEKLARILMGKTAQELSRHGTGAQQKQFRGDVIASALSDKQAEDQYKASDQILKQNVAIKKATENKLRSMLNANRLVDKEIKSLEIQQKNSQMMADLSGQRLKTQRGTGAITMRGQLNRSKADLKIQQTEQDSTARFQSQVDNFKRIKSLSESIGKDISVSDMEKFAQDPSQMNKSLGFTQDDNQYAIIEDTANAIKIENEQLEQKLELNKQNTLEQQKQLDNQLKMTTGPDAYANGFDAYAKAASDRVDTFKYELGQAVPEAFSRNMSAAMMKVIREGGSWKEAMIDGLIGTLDTINQKFMDNWMDNLFSGFSQETPEDSPDYITSTVSNFKQNLDTTIDPLTGLSRNAAAAAEALMQISTINPVKTTPEEQAMMSDKVSTKNIPLAPPPKRSPIIDPTYQGPQGGKNFPPIVTPFDSGNVNPNNTLRNVGTGGAYKDKIKNSGKPIDYKGSRGLQQHNRGYIMDPQAYINPAPALQTLTVPSTHSTSTSTSTTTNSTSGPISSGKRLAELNESQRGLFSTFSTYRDLYDTPTDPELNGKINANGSVRNAGLSGELPPTDPFSRSTTSTTSTEASLQGAFPGIEQPSIEGSSTAGSQDEIVQAIKDQTSGLGEAFGQLTDKFEEIKIDEDAIKEKVETTALGVQHETPPQTGAAHVNPNTGQYADPSLRKAQMEQVESVFAQAAQQSAQALQNEAMQKDAHVQQMTEKAGTLQTSVQRVIETLGELSTAISTKAQEIQQIQIQQSMPSPGIGASAPGSYTGGILRRSGGGGVPAKVSDGEFVMNRDAVKKFGVSNMSILNSGRVPNSAQGYMPGFTNGGKPKIWDSDRINKQGAKESFGQGAATMALGFGLSKLFEKDKEENKAWERPDDYFQRNPTWKKRNMSKQFMLNDRRVAEEVQKERSKKNEETQKWIEKMNKRQALGRQAVSLVGNVLASSASQGLTAKDGSFAGFSNEKFEMPKFFGGKFSGGEISGTPGIDRIPTMLTEGEYVINARAAKQIGVPTLERINAGKYNQGGLVGDSTEKNLENSSSNPTNNINITVNVSSDNSSKENSSQDQDNSEPQKKKKSAEDLSKRIKQEVITVIKEENRPGGLLR